MGISNLKCTYHLLTMECSLILDALRVQWHLAHSVDFISFFFFVVKVYPNAIVWQSVDLNMQRASRKPVQWKINNWQMRGAFKYSSQSVVNGSIMATETTTTMTTTSREEKTNNNNICSNKQATFLCFHSVSFTLLSRFYWISICVA